MRTRKGAATLIGSGRQEVKVCDIINGIPKIKQVEKGNYIELRLTYSMFHREIKRYDKETFEIQRNPFTTMIIYVSLMRLSFNGI